MVDAYIMKSPPSGAWTGHPRHIRFAEIALAGESPGTTRHHHTAHNPMAGFHYNRDMADPLIIAGQAVSVPADCGHREVQIVSGNGARA